MGEGSLFGGGPAKQDIPVYVVQREHGRSTRKMLHSNLVLPFMALPASKPNPLDTSVLIDGTQPSPADTTTSIENPEQEDLVGSSSVMKKALLLQLMQWMNPQCHRRSILSLREDLL